MTRIPRLIVGLAMLWLAHAAAWAGDCGPYQVGLREYPKFYERVRGKPGVPSYVGLDKDFFEELAKRTGCRLVLQVESQPRIWSHLKDGSLDMAGWFIPTLERHAHVVVLPLLTARPVAITWASSGVKTEQDFLANPALRAVAIRQMAYGAGYDNLLARLRAMKRVDEVADLDAAVRAFVAGRVALLITYPWTLRDQPKQVLDELTLSDWESAAAPILAGLALSRRTVREEDLQKIQQGLRGMQRDGSLSHLVDKYMLPGSVGYLPATSPWEPGAR